VVPAVPVVVLVEGASDAAAVRVLCPGRGIDGSAVEIRDMGGLTNVGRHLSALDARSRVLGLYDAPEERFVLRALQRHGYAVADRGDLERHGFHACVRDLEDELIRALGAAEVESVLGELGLLERFRGFQEQPQWRRRTVEDQLRRFAGTTSGRKLLLAEALTRRLTDAVVPPPLRRLTDDLEGAVTP